tara:strand:+ start:656 stop:769 length:114 start_codon:yes stop_codon:yes gene_type:complete
MSKVAPLIPGYPAYHHLHPIQSSQLIPDIPLKGFMAA